MLLLGNTRERTHPMVNNSSIGLTGLVLLALYGHGYMVPATSKATQLTVSATSSGDARVDALSRVDQERTTARLALADRAVPVAPPAAVVGESSGPSLFDGFVFSEAAHF